MPTMPVDAPLVGAAVAEAKRRWPDRDGVAAAIRVADGEILTGVPLPNFNAAMSLCAETGPLCVAYTNKQQVVASVCVGVDHSTGAITVLAPCGACQERRALWGSEVEVGVDDPVGATGWSSKRLSDLNPFYWAATSTRDRSWPMSVEHEWFA
jgi:cytidine deaminase